MKEEDSAETPFEALGKKRTERNAEVGCEKELVRAHK
jgi:hypothetical protein